MGASRRLLLLALVAAALTPAAAADDVLVPSDEAHAPYPHCERPSDVPDRPRACLCPWPWPADGLLCPLPE